MSIKFSDLNHLPEQLLTDSIDGTKNVASTDFCAEDLPVQAERRPDILSSATQSKLIEFLEDSIDSSVTLEALAQQADMSIPVFITAFRVAFHTTPYQYLLDLRFERAKYLLRHTSHPIAEVSALVGFSRPSHFSGAFRRRVGVSPRVYRDRPTKQSSPR